MEYLFSKEDKKMKVYCLSYEYICPSDDPCILCSSRCATRNYIICPPHLIPGA